MTYAIPGRRYTNDADPLAELKDRLWTWVPESERAEIEKLLDTLAGGAQDEPPDFPGAPRVTTGYSGPRSTEANDFAMDASPNTARGMGGMRRALARVERLVGPVLAADSATDVFQEGLKRLGVDARGIHGTALPALFDATVRSRRADSGRASAGMSLHPVAPAGHSAGFSARFPNAARIRCV